MKKILSILLISCLIVPLISCSSKKKKSIKSQKKQTISIKKNVENKKGNKADLFNDEAETFYTVNPKLEDIESEIALLKEQVIQYESQISTPNFNTEILKLLKNPTIKHEIQLSNGTTIQGVIIYENADQMIVETQIGQLQINKDQVIATNDVLPPIANLEFVGDAIEEIYDDQRAYKGSIKNNGLKRADFVRIIYTLHDENSNLITSDSTFIDGTKKIFNSGLISNASIEPGEFATFYVTIETTNEKEIKYFLRDIRWEYFE